MIKLVSQFDNEKSRISLATPTCCGGCCCCCCCCLISTIATASISARNFGELVKERYPDDDKKVKSAKRIGFLYPVVILIAVILEIMTPSFILFNVSSNIWVKLLMALVTPVIVASILWTAIFNKKYEISDKSVYKKFFLFGFMWCGLAIAEEIIFFIYFVKNLN